MYSQKARCIPPTLDKSSTWKEKESLGSHSSRGSSVQETSSLSKERKRKLKDLESSVEKIKINYEKKGEIKNHGLGADAEEKDRADRRALRITKDELSTLNKKYLGGKNGATLNSDSNSDCRSLFTANSGSENSIQSSSSSYRYQEKDSNLVSDFDAESEGGNNESVSEINDNENEKISESFSEHFARNNRFRFQDSSEVSEERGRTPPLQRSPARLAVIEAILKNYSYYEDDDLIADVGQADYVAPNLHISNESKRWETDIPTSMKGYNDRIWPIKSYSHSNNGSNSNSHSNSNSNRSDAKDTVIESYAWQIPLIKIRSTYLLQKALSHRHQRRKPSESYKSNYNTNNNTRDPSNNNSNHSNSIKSNNNSHKNNSNKSNKSSTFNYCNNNNIMNHWSILEGSSSESQCKNDPIVPQLNKSSRHDELINRSEKEVKHSDPPKGPLRILSTIKIPSTVCTVS